jgi:cyclophilin family peptidyl-prolyl cis-trans isomerase
MTGEYEGPRRTRLPFPVNLILNVKAFYIFFIVVMIASMAAVGFAGSTANNDPAPVVPEVTLAPTAVDNISFPDGPAPVIDATKPHEAVITTNKGDIKVELATDTPTAVNSLAFLAGNGFYTDTAFFYVNHDYFAQGGDPNCSPSKDTLCTGTGGPDYTLPIEHGALSHEQWAVVAPAMPDGQSVHGSQFRILYQADPRLDGTETVFGTITDPASREILESLTAFELCSTVDSSECQEDQDFTDALIIEKVVVQPK